MRKLQSKKGDIAVSLSWVFMIIVGVFFIMLAYNIIAKYMHNEDVKYEIELKNALRGIFNDVGRTTGVEKNSLAPLKSIFKDSKVEIICNDGIPILSINDNFDTNNQYLKSYPTFMTYIDQNKVEYTYMAVENFKMPFKVTNMLAIVSKKNLIVFDSSSNIGDELAKKFKKTSYNELNIEYLDFTTTTQEYFKENYVDDRNLNSIILVTDSGNTFNFNLDEFDELTYLVEVDQSSDEKSGTIKYTDQTGSTKEFKYVDYDKTLALVTMAIFSSPQTFECSYDLLISNIETSYDFYINKTNYYLDQSDQGKVVCLSSYNTFDISFYYSDLKDAFVDVLDKIKTDRFNNPASVVTSIDNLETEYLRLENINCPYIY